jgi:LPS sulfotransferase NodH
VLQALRARSRNLMPDGRPRLLVTCAARTGSTMLVHFLQSHPDMCVHGEVLAPKGPLNYYGINYRLPNPPLEGILMSIRDRDPVAFLHDFVWQPGSRAVSGFKGKYEELLLPQYRPVLDAIVNDTSVKVIHLTRDDLLARYLSQYIAVTVHGFFQLLDEQDRPKETTVRLSPEKAEEDFRRTEGRQRAFADRFSGHEVLDVTYEQLVRAPDETLGAIQQFLGVSEQRDLRSPSKKVSMRSPRETIANYEELAEYFANTQYRHFFEAG